MKTHFPVPLTAALLAALCLAPSPLTAAHGHTFMWSGSYSFGDVDQNGFVNAQDRNAIVCALTNGTATNVWMDIDEDGLVTANDAYLSLGAEFARVPPGVHAQGLSSNEALSTTPMCSIIGLAVTPRHPVYLDEYFLARFESTTEDYVEFLNSLGAAAALAFERQYTTDMMSGATNGYATVLCGSGACTLCGAQYVWTNKPLVWVEAAGITTNAGGRFVVAAGVPNFRAVSGISFYGAVQYCATYGLTLPTEYQWEKAALCIPTNPLEKTSYALAMPAPLSQGDVPNVAAANFGNNYHGAALAAGTFCGATYASGETYAVEYKVTTNQMGEFTYVPVVYAFAADITTSNAFSPFSCYNMVGNVRELTRDLHGPVDTNATIATMFGQTSYRSLTYVSNAYAGTVTNPWNNTVGGAGSHGGEGEVVCVRGASAQSSFSLYSPFGTQLRGDCRLTGVIRGSDGVPARSDGFRVAVEAGMAPAARCRTFLATPRLALVPSAADYCFDIVIDNVDASAGNLAALEIALETSSGVIPAITFGTNAAFTPGVTQVAHVPETSAASLHIAARTRSAGVLKNTGTGVVTLATCMIMPPSSALIENLSIATEKTKLFDDRGCAVAYEVVPEPGVLLGILGVIVAALRTRRGYCS